MSEQASQPAPEQIPGQEQLWAPEQVGHEAYRDKDAFGRFMGSDLSGPVFPQPSIDKPGIEPELSQVGNAPADTKELPAAIYESGVARGLGKLARYFEKGAETADKGMEKAQRFGRFLGRTATKGQAFIETIKERVNTGKEIWKSGGDTKTQRLGALANKAVLQPALKGAEKATRHMGGNLSELRQENAQSKAGYMHTQAEMLARQAAAETDPEAKAKLELEIAKLGHKQTVSRAKAEVHAARAHRRRTGSPVRVVASEKTESVPVAKAA